MDYDTFSKLYDSAIGSELLQFLVGNGFEDWMSKYENAYEISRIKETIHRYANNDISVMIHEATKNMIDFGHKYDIPYRTLQNWASGSTTVTPYLKKLLAFAVISSPLN